MIPDLADGERALMALSLQMLPPVLAGLMLAAVISAILSTVSSQLLVAASAVSYDVVEGAMDRRADDRRSLVLGRWTVAAVGMLGVLLALTEVRLVFWFVLFAWSALGASFGPLVLLSLTRNAVNRHGALAAMLTGSGVTVAWRLGRVEVGNPEAFTWVPAATILVAILVLAGARLAGGLSRGVIAAVIAAAGLTLLSWWIVPLGWSPHLYELVPAFLLAGGAAMGVSRLVHADD
jgi:Na+/proline symporter